MGSKSTTPSKTALVSALAPLRGKKRLVWFAHEGKKLAGAVTISGDSPGPYTAKMLPWAVVTGHVVGKDKKPRDGLVFHVQAGESAFIADFRGRKIIYATTLVRRQSSGRRRTQGAGSPAKE